MNLKKPLTFSEQVEKLNEHGIIIKDAEKKAVEEYLSHVNYYKLTGYTLQFRKEAESSNLATSHTVSEIKKLYDFDADMRQMLRGYLEIVETYCKTQIANSFALEKCMTPPYDQHYNEANYYNCLFGLPDKIRHISGHITRHITGHCKSFLCHFAVPPYSVASTTKNSSFGWSFTLVSRNFSMSKVSFLS